MVNLHHKNYDIIMIMNKIKYIITFTLLSVFLYACGGSDNDIEVTPFDTEAQALIDGDSLTKFLSNYYYDTNIDSLKPIEPGKTALINESADKLKRINVTENDINYTLYVYVNNVGTPEPMKGFPTVMDSILVTYQGQKIARTDSLSTFETRRTPVWLNLNAVIRGWTYGFPNFKGGKNVTANGPITYENGGKGLLIIPSGLAYGNFGSGIAIGANQNLLFYINLFDIVEDTDVDNDNVPSIFEDPDGDGDPRNDDSDSDGIPNYADTDDDGDGVLTKFEDKNLDGNPRNDFNDPNNPTLPDYLNFKFRFSKQ